MTALSMALTASAAGQRRAAVLCRRLFAAFLCAWALWGPALAVTAAVPAATLPSTGTLPLAGHLSMLRDPGGAMTIGQVAGGSGGRFVPLKGQLTEGFTPDAIWLRFSLASPPQGADSGPWWLSLSQALMSEASLFEPDGRGGFLELPGAGTAGAARAPATGATMHRKVGFVVSVPPGEARTYFLRLQTRASVSTSLDVQPLGEFRQAYATDSLVSGILIGAFALTVLIFLTLWRWSGERVHLLYALALTGSLAASTIDGGWLIHLLPGWPRQAWLRPLGTFITLGLPLWTWFTLEFIQFHRSHPLPARAFVWTSWAIALTAIVAIQAGAYRQAMPIVMACALASIIMLAVAVVIRVAQGSREARIALVASSLFWVGITVRFLRNTGVLEPGPWIDNTFLVGNGFHTLAMGAGVFASYARLRREKQQAEARTQAELRLRDEQRQFVAMVSHELRSPLAIISASTDNLLADPALTAPARARAEKIMRAGERMRQLMETYLANERYLQATALLSPKPQDLARLCRMAIADLDDSGIGPVQLDGPATVPVTCDGELIRLCLQNLLINARRHSPADRPVQVRLVTLPGKVTVSVRNHGRPIPEDEIPKLFTRFFRGRLALDTPGAGLGLFLVKTIVEQHHGDVSAHNRDDGTVEFAFSLPVRPA